MLTKIFGHVAIDENPAVLDLIRTDPEVNGVIFRQPAKGLLRAYLNSLTSEDDLALNIGDDLFLDRNGRAIMTYADVKGAGFLFHSGKTSPEEVGDLLSEGFPLHDGFKVFADDVHSTMEVFCRAAGYKEVTSSFVVSLSTGAGCWHHDNDTDVRGFKAYKSGGSLIRANKTVTEWRPAENFYGGFREKDGLSKDDITQMNEGDFGIWKGDCHERPLIHVKPNVKPGEFRLSLMINPTEAAYLETLEQRGMKRFYKEPQP